MEEISHQSGFHKILLPTRKVRTYNCHTCEDGKGEPGSCHGRNLREPSFQADNGHLDIMAVRSAIGDPVRG